MAQGNLVVIDPPPAPPRGKKGRLMEYIQQSVVVSGEDENATSQNENNQAWGGGISNSQPTPLSNNDKLISLSHACGLQPSATGLPEFETLQLCLEEGKSRVVQPSAIGVQDGGWISKIVSHHNAQDCSPKPPCGTTVTHPK